MYPPNLSVPDVIMGVELNGVVAMWAVHHRTLSAAPAANPYHAYLIISEANSTLVLEAGDEMNELDAEGSEFKIDVPTIAAGREWLMK